MAAVLDGISTADTFTVCQVLGLSTSTLSRNLESPIPQARHCLSDLQKVLCKALASDCDTAPAVLDALPAQLRHLKDQLHLDLDVFHDARCCYCVNMCCLRSFRFKFKC